MIFQSMCCVESHFFTLRKEWNDERSSFFLATDLREHKITLQSGHSKSAEVLYFSVSFPKGGGRWAP